MAVQPGTVIGVGELVVPTGLPGIQGLKGDQGEPGIQGPPGQDFPDAPDDGQAYARAGAAWVPALPLAGGNVDTLTVGGEPAATRDWTQAWVGGLYLPLAGGVAMQGPFTLAGDGAEPLAPATVQQLDAAIAGVQTAVFPEAPDDGQSYGRVGASQSWVPVLPLAGGMVTGPVTFNGAVFSLTPDPGGYNLRMLPTNPATQQTAFWRNDGSSLYLLLTNAGDPSGTWNSQRPFTVNLASQDVSMGGNLTAAGNITANGGIVSSTFFRRARGDNYIAFDDNPPANGFAIRLYAIDSAFAINWVGSDPANWIFQREGVGTIAFISNVGQYAQTSDARLKSDESPITGGIGLVRQLAPKSFRFTNDILKRYSWGFVAQDTQPVIPAAVLEHTEENGETTLGIDHTAILAAVTQAVKQLHSRAARIEASLGLAVPDEDLA